LQWVGEIAEPVWPDVAFSSPAFHNSATGVPQDRVRSTSQNARCFLTRSYIIQSPLGAFFGEATRRFLIEIATAGHVEILDTEL
jgi:hypothetical protein